MKRRKNNKCVGPHTRAECQASRPFALRVRPCCSDPCPCSKLRSSLRIHRKCDSSNSAMTVQNSRAAPKAYVVLNGALGTPLSKPVCGYMHPCFFYPWKPHPNIRCCYVYTLSRKSSMFPDSCNWTMTAQNSRAATRMCVVLKGALDILSKHVHSHDLSL